MAKSVITRTRTRTYRTTALVCSALFCFVRLMQWLMSSLIEAMFDAMVDAMVDIMVDTFVH